MTVKVLSASAVTVFHTDSLDMPTATVNNLSPVKSKMGQEKKEKITLLYSCFPQTHHFQNAFEPQVLQHFDSVCCSKKHVVHPHCCRFALYFLSPFFLLQEVDVMPHELKWQTLVRKHSANEELGSTVGRPKGH